jgi:hypothetical protein
MSEHEMLREVVNEIPVTINNKNPPNANIDWDIQRYYEAMGFDFDHDEEDNNR